MASAPCAFHAITGLPCGFCGGTRALRLAASGEWEASLRMNPVALPAAGAGLLASAVLLAEVFLRWRLLPAPPVGGVPLLGLALLS
ncbi:MAG: DUF2752 domain-containing protein, partial [Terrimicrobiaceae bacterium]|nr:DUF2752 domain-containing protein [Terrimicrobiaceae bacterium]